MWKIILLVIMSHFCTVMSAKCITVFEPTKDQEAVLEKNMKIIECLKNRYSQAVNNYYHKFFKNMANSQSEKDSTTFLAGFRIDPSKRAHQIKDGVHKLIKDEEIYSKYYKKCKTEIVDKYLKKMDDVTDQFKDCESSIGEFVKSVKTNNNECKNTENNIYSDMENRKWELFFKLNYYKLKLEYCSIRHLTKFFIFNPYLSVIYRTRRCMLEKAGKKLRFT